jgi:hypothetical protein
VPPPPTWTSRTWAGSREREVTVVTTVQGWRTRISSPHEGDGVVTGPLRHAPPVVDRSVGRSCASVSRGKRVSKYDGNF